MDLIFIFIDKLINNNIVSSIKAVEIKRSTIRNIGKFFLQFVMKIKTFDNINFFFFIQKMNTNLLLTNYIFLGTKNIVIIKRISKLRIEKAENLIIRHDYYLPKKWDSASFFSTKISFLSVPRQAPAGFFLSFWDIFFYVRFNNSLIMFVRKGSRIAPTPVMNNFKVYYHGFF